MPKEKQKTVLGVYWEHLKKYKWSTTILLVVIVLAESIGVLTPWIYKRVVDGFTQNPHALSSGASSELLFLLMVAVGVHALGWILWRVSGFIAASIQPKIVEDLARTAFEALLKRPYQFFADHFSGALVRKSRDFAGSFRQILQNLLWGVLPLIVSLTGIILVLSRRSLVLSALVVIFFVLYFFLNLLFFRWKLKYDKERAAKDSAVTGLLSDAITNSVNIRLFTAKKHETDLYSRALEERQKIRTLQWRLSEYNNLAQNILTIAIEAAAMYSAFYLWKKGSLTVGDFVLLQAYLYALFQKLFNLGGTIKDVYESLADAQEMVDILNQPIEIQDKKTAKLLAVTRGAITFQNVTFRYHHKGAVLKNFALSIKSHEKVALVGSSGAGKSTVVKLLFRFYDLDRGKILIDGQSIRDVTQDSLHEQISLVPQEPILFHRSLRENIRYGRRDATDKEVIEAAKKAHCHEFISTSPYGYDTLVGERGIKLSGGERQRIAIARAILKDAPILVLDEATSSLDSESESLIQDALHALMADKTVIVIAHRLSTIMQMDRIVVMENGSVVETGTHEELLKKTGIYQKLWEIQAGGFLG